MFQTLLLGVALLQSPSLDERIHQPYVDLIQNPTSYSSDTLKSLRSKIQQERDEKIDAAKKTEKEWKAQLKTTREELQALNRRASTDSTASSLKREELHTTIAALERGIREKNKEREYGIPNSYESPLAKLWLLEHWPDKRGDILRRLDKGNARDRQHGDVDDIGYRRLVKDPEKDLEVGQQAARQMTAGGWLPAELKDPDVQIYVRKLAGNLAANSDLKIPLHVTVLDSAEPRAIALPGGFLYVTSGLLLAAHSESELAGVLTREIARIAAQHATRASKRSIVSKMFMPVAQIATGIFSGGINPGAYYGIGYGMQGLGGVMDRVLNGTNEGYQKEADQLGLQYAWKAGYDPRGFINFLDSLNADSKSDLVGKEPELNKRLLNLFSEIEYLKPLQNPAVDSPEFQAARLKLIAASGS